MEFNQLVVRHVYIEREWFHDGSNHLSPLEWTQTTNSIDPFRRRSEFSLLNSTQSVTPIFKRHRRRMLTSAGRSQVVCKATGVRGYDQCKKETRIHIDTRTMTCVPLPRSYSSRGWSTAWSSILRNHRGDGLLNITSEAAGFVLYVVVSTVFSHPRLPPLPKGVTLASSYWHIHESSLAPREITAFEMEWGSRGCVWEAERRSE